VPNAGYQTQSVMTIGKGYWVSLASQSSVTLNGDGIAVSDSIPVSDGWNLIGSINTPILASTIHSDPPGMITSHFFKYNNSYSVSDTIDPGSGYWVKVSGNGTLVLSSSGTEQIPSASKIKIIPTDELPPSPPDHDIQDVKSEIPDRFSLERNYPNPFNPTTVIRYQIPLASRVKLTIYNLLGQEVTTLVDEVQEAGYKSVKWDAQRISSGIYFYKLQAGSFTSVKKMMLIK